MKKILLQFVTLICIALSGTISLSGQQSVSTYQLQFQGNNVLPPALSSEEITNHTVANYEIISGRYYRIVQFYNIPIQETREEIESMGIRLLDYLPNNAYVASIPESFDMGLLSGYNVRSVIPFYPAFKFAPQLTEYPFPDWAVPFAGRVDVSISFYRDIPIQTIIPSIQLLADEILELDDFSKTVILRIAETNLEKLAQLPYINYMSPVDPPSKPENYTAKTITRSNAINNQFVGGRHYDGNGVKVMLQDDGLIGPHIDYQGRIGMQYTTDPTGSHGDHIAGTIMGAGNMDPKTRGFAPAADIYVYNVYDGIDSIPVHYFNPGIVITSTSYSNGCNAGYTAFARTHDQQINQYPSLMHVFSSGNDGTSNCSYGAGAGWGNITGGHKVGKNVIAVGNLTELDILNNSSSRGPAHDGRIKPDICAKGTSVYSTIPTNSYQNNTGTSMSCPNISGSLVQLYSAYKEFNSGNNPPSALMKAIILNTADDLGNPGPDFKHGWGRINNLRAAKVIESQSYFSDTITHGNTKTHVITVPTGTQQVRVMVYWADPEALAGAARALVNNINIQLTAPSTTVYNPWVLDPTPIVANLNANAVRGIDSLNNVEQVTLDSPAAGNYSLSVSGFNIPQGPQTYYVVYEFVTSEITVTYPMGGESLVPGEIELIRWDAFGNSGNFNVQYSADSGFSWNTLSSTVAGSMRHLSWTVPVNVTGKSLIKVSRGTDSDVSDAPFSIIGVPTNLDVQWACSNYFRIKWDSVPGANGYEVSLLGTKYMDSVGRTTNFYFDITGINSSNTYWYSVKALGPNNAYGRRAIAKEKAPGSFNCPSPNNAGLGEIINPASSILMDCQSTNQVIITVKIENVATNTLSNIPVKYQILNGPVITETFAGPLTTGASAVFTFSTKANLSVVGNYILKTWVDYPGDVEHDNDTIIRVLQIIPGTIVSLPHQENFEAFTLCSTASTCELVSCATVNGWTNEGNGIGDDIDWRTNAGGTPSSGTGPSTDHNPGTTNGKYLYLEASGTCDGREGIFVSPCINLANTSNPKMTFWYSMNGNNMGSLSIDVFSNGTWILNAWTKSGNQGAAWQGDTLDLTAYTGDTINIRFRGITGIDYLSDMAIDDIGFFQHTVYPQAGFSENATAGCVGATIQFFDQSYNSPTNWLWTFNPSTVTFLSGTSATSQNPIVRFDAAGTYDVKLLATNSFGGDSLTKSSYITIDAGVTLPLFEDFESFSACGTNFNCGVEICALGNDWVNWANGSQDDIDWRVDAGGTPSGSTGPVIDHKPGTSTGNYVYLEASNGCFGQVASLVSPCIDLANTNLPVLSFWYHMYGINMGSLHVDILSSGIWTNDIMFVLQGDQGNAWHNRIIDLSAYIGKVVQLRFRGITGNDYASDMALDDISVVDMTAPVTSFLADDTICINTTTIVTDISQGFGIDYNWNFGAGANPANSNTKGPHLVIYNTPGLKTIKLVTTNLAGTDSLEKNIWVEEMPIADFGITSNSASITFSDSSTGGSTHYWDFGDGTYSNLKDPTHLYTSTGLYYVTHITSNTCGADSIEKTVWVVMPGFDNSNRPNIHIEVFPNPSEDVFQIKVEGISEYSWKVTDITGKLILQSSFNNQAGQIQKLDMANEASGVYFLQIDAGTFSVFKRLLLE